MKTSLKSLSQIDAYNGFHLYQGLASEPLLPGEYLIYQKQSLEILRCREHGESWQLLLQSNESLSLPEKFVAEHTGQAVNHTPMNSVHVLAEGVGVSMAMHWLDALRNQLGDRECRKLISTVIVASTNGFSFRPVPSTFMLSYLPTQMIAAVPLLEDLGIASRLCNDQFMPGCFEGSLTDLVSDQATQITSQPWVGFVSEQTSEALTERLGQAEYVKNIEE